MGFPVLSSFCGLSLRTGGLIIGYSQFFLSAIMINCAFNLSTQSIAFSAFFVICMITGLPFIFGILLNEPACLRPNIIWGKIVFVLGTVLCLWFAVWDVLFVIGMVADLIPMYKMANVIMSVHIAWLVCAIVTVLSWYLVSLMSSLYESVTDVESHENAHVDNVNIDNDQFDEQHTLLTFKIYETIKSDAQHVTKYIKNSFESLEKYFNKFQEYVARKLAEFVELPVETTDTPDNVCHIKMDKQNEEKRARNENDSCNITVETDADKEIIATKQNDVVEKETV